MCVFAVPGPCLYLDLDITIIGDLAPLLDAATRHDFVALGDFWLDGPHRINSSIMGWRGDLSGLYHEFADAPAAHMSIYSTRAKWGDQRFIADTYAGEIMTWQRLLPGTVCSYKLGALAGEDLSNCRIVCSHGQPRPWAPRGADAWFSGRQAAARGMVAAGGA